MVMLPAPLIVALTECSALSDRYVPSTLLVFFVQPMTPASTAGAIPQTLLSPESRFPACTACWPADISDDDTVRLTTSSPYELMLAELPMKGGVTSVEAKNSVPV
jgi:hypothetical protein